MTALPLALAAAHVALAVVVIPRLGVLHPWSLWLLGFSATTTLYALHLLPYGPMGASTAVALLAATVAVGAGTLAGGHLGQRRCRPLPPPVERSSLVVELAAGLVLVLLGAWALLYVLQVSARYGLRATLVTSIDVRLDLAQGVAALGIKFVYVSLASAALSGVACAVAPTRRRRVGWGVAVAAAGAVAYLSTGRANIILPLAVGLVAYGTARHRSPRFRTQLVAAVAAVAVVLVVFLAGGRIIGKTFANNPMSALDTVFTRHEALRPFALPYLYATGPIAALDVQVDVAAGLPSTDGCATLAVACRLGQAVGLDTVPVPAIRSFTRPPLAWNTYTALDQPLLDGGLAGVVGCFSLVGLGLGWLWRRARRRSTSAVALYGLAAGAAILYAPVQNNFFAPQVLGAGAIVLVGLLAASRLAPYVERRRRRAAAGATDDST